MQLVSHRDGQRSYGWSSPVYLSTSFEPATTNPPTTAKTERWLNTCGTAEAARRLRADITE
jgi:hypothetical protein